VQSQPRTADLPLADHRSQPSAEGNRPCRSWDWATLSEDSRSASASGRSFNSGEAHGSRRAAIGDLGLSSERRDAAPKSSADWTQSEAVYLKVATKVTNNRDRSLEAGRAHPTPRASNSELVCCAHWPEVRQFSRSRRAATPHCAAGLTTQIQCKGAYSGCGMTVSTVLEFVTGVDRPKPAGCRGAAPNSRW
jgi:hypothetical protein